MIIKTRNFIAAHRLLDLCFHNQKIGIITAESGQGKTYSLENYEPPEMGSILSIEGNDPYPVKDMLLDIAEGLGINIFGSQYRMQKRIVSEIEKRKQHQNIMIVVDEANMLRNIAHLHILRKIHMHGGCAVVLLGTPALEKMFKRSSGGNDLSQFENRISYSYRFNTLNDKELAVFIEGFEYVIEPKAKQLLMGLYKSNCFRWLNDVLQENIPEVLAKQKQNTVSEQTVRVAERLRFTKNGSLRKGR